MSSEKSYKLVSTRDTDSASSDDEVSAVGRAWRWFTGKPSGMPALRDPEPGSGLPTASCSEKDSNPAKVEARKKTFANAVFLGRQQMEEEDMVLVKGKDETANVERRIPNRRLRKLRHIEYDSGNQHAGVVHLPGTDQVIDFVLVWEESPDEEDAKKAAKHRVHFLARLRKVGLITHTVESDNNPQVKFVLLHAPFKVLLTIGESLHLKMPVSKSCDGKMNFSEKILSKLSVRNPMLVPSYEGSKRPFYRAATVTTARLHSFLGSHNLSTFFRPSQRSSIVSHILERTKYGTKPGSLGVSQLLANGSYKAAFPLHQGKSSFAGSLESVDWDANDVCPREELALTWASLSCWYKYQPLHKIRDYFGEQVAFYFTWVGFYSMSLVPAAIAGLITFIYGLATIGTDLTVAGVCKSSHVMCPTCESCKFWKLSDICLSVKSGHVFDNEATILYGLFLCLWASTFLEFWKRKAAVSARQWNCDAHEEQEPVRAQYAAKAKRLSPNTITGDLEPHLSQAKWPLYVSVYMAVTLLFCAVAIWLVSVVVYRAIIAHVFGEPYHSSASPLANVSASIMNLVVVLITRKAFNIVAVKLTEFENHRTESQFGNHLSFKLFIFDCATLFALPVYVAFFKGRFAGFPHHFQTGLLHYHGQQCGSFGCILELSETAGIVLIGKLVLDKVLDVISWLRSRSAPSWSRAKQSRASNDGVFLDYEDTEEEEEEEAANQWEQDYKLPRPKQLHWQYLEMVMQFGLVTIFGVAFPLAPLVAMVNNVIEIRLDAMNYVKHTCRIVATAAQDIGIWFTLLDLLAKVAVFTTAMILTFSSGAVAKLLYRVCHGAGSLSGFVEHSLSSAVVLDTSNGRNVTCRYVDSRSADGSYTAEYWYLLTARLVFVLIFENVVFVAVTVMDWAIPDVPTSLQNELARDVYQARRAVESTSSWHDGGDAGSTSASASRRCIAIPRTGTRRTRGMSRKRGSIWRR